MRAECPAWESPVLAMGRGVQKCLSAGGTVLKVEALSLKDKPGRLTNRGEELWLSSWHANTWVPLVGSNFCPNVSTQQESWIQ